MNDTDDTIKATRRPRVLFSAKYGALPRFFWYFVIPFLLLAAGALFVRAAWFGEGVEWTFVRVPPKYVAWGICPLLVGMCGVLLGAEVYHRRNPQFVRATTAGVTLPKGRFTAATVSMAWDNLEATLEGRNLSGWHVYDVNFREMGSGVKAHVTSMLFRDFDDFATFAQIIGEHIGEDWSIKGFLPGTIRGRKKKKQQKGEG